MFERKELTENQREITKKLGKVYKIMNEIAILITDPADYFPPLRISMAAHFLHRIDPKVWTKQDTQTAQILAETIMIFQEDLEKREKTKNSAIHVPEIPIADVEKMVNEVLKKGDLKS